MIELYSGTPGSGKSLHMAFEIRSRLKKNNRVIIGNFYINTSIIKKRKGSYIMVMNDRLTPDRLLDFSRKLSRHLGRRLKEGEILLLIDEAQLLFNSREWQNLAHSGWLSFFSQHRHYGFDIILAAQFDRMLDRQVRCLLEYEIIHRKVNRFGFIGAVIGLFTGKNLYIAIKKWYPLKEKIDSSLFLGSKKLFAIYDSYNHFDGPGQKQKTEQRAASAPTVSLPSLSRKEPEQEKEETEDLELIDLESVECAAPGLPCSQNA